MRMQSNPLLYSKIKNSTDRLRLRRSPENNVVGVGSDVAEASRREEESLDVTVAEASRREEENLDVTVVIASPKSGEKKVGILLAAAMKKYTVPRSSCYHGVTKLKWSRKFEAHLWDNTSQVEGRKRKGKHVYLGSYYPEEKATRAHDLAALKYWGPTSSAKLNFPVSGYERELETMKNMSQDEYVAHVRRSKIGRDGPNDVQERRMQ